MTRRPLTVVMALAAVAAVLAVGGSQPDASLHPAADLAMFNAGNIISDEVFFAGSAMSAAQIQTFLDARNPNSVPGPDGTPCLRTFTQTTTTRAPDANCGGYVGAANEPAATIISKVALSCNVSPKVLVVMLEKERGLIRASGSSLTEGDYRIAMGYGCPDTAACDTQYYGFQNQVYMAAWQMQKYAKNPGNYTYKAGRTVNIQWHPNAACGSAPVAIQNQATAGLYNYTPYQPNGAALGRGGSTECSSYGNRNFWVYFTDWFVSTQSDAVVAASPRGNVESLELTASGFTASGWSFDPDAATSAVTVQATVDGAPVGPVTTTLPRPDVNNAFGIGGNHGFALSGDLAFGSHQVCIVANNLAGQGVAIQLACKFLDFTNRAPVLGVETFAEQPDGSVLIGGWAYDPDGSATALHVYDNGVGKAYSTTVARPDVQAAAPVAGSTAGFSISVGPLAGSHSVCLFAVDTVAPGNNRLVQCPTFGYKAPVGRVDGVSEDASGGLAVSGWVYDPSLPTTSMDAHVYLDGRGVAVHADQPRPDIAAAFPGAGSAHGFSTVIPTTAGTHSLCVFGYNIGIGGTNPILLCTTVTLTYQAPTGNVELITSGGAGQARVAGWSLDPSVPTAPLTMHVWVDGRPLQAVTANLPRPDLQRFYPTAGPNHGFDALVPIGPGRHQVCVFALNNGVPGANLLLRCGDVTG
jgi:hypothetical protein